MYTHQGFLESRGYFAVSNQDQLEWAKNNPELIDLANATRHICDTIPPNNWFVPKFYSTFKRRDDFPMWVWRVAGWRLNELKVRDIAMAYLTNPRDDQEVEVLARIENIRGDSVEISILGTGHCVWVDIGSVKQINIS